jgi:hypothetical protein
MAPSSSGLRIGVNLVVTMTAILRLLSRFNRAERSLRQKLQSTAAGTNAAFGLLGDNEAAFLHDRVSFSSLGMRGFLRGPIGSWHIS